MLFGSEGNNSTVSPRVLELSFMYVQWSQSVTLFPVREASQRIASQALLTFIQQMGQRAALKRLVQDCRNALTDLRERDCRCPFFSPDGFRAPETTSRG